MCASSCEVGDPKFFSINAIVTTEYVLCSRPNSSQIVDIAGLIIRVDVGNHVGTCWRTIRYPWLKTIGYITSLVIRLAVDKYWVKV